MRTSYRDIFLLACCQALLLVNTSGLITVNGLVGYSLADAAGWGSMNTVALPFIAVVALATAWLAVLRQTPATPRARPPQGG
jgi:hypothetical protein